MRSNNRRSRSKTTKKSKRSNRKTKKSQRGKGYELAVNLPNVGGQAIVNRYNWCENKTPLNLQLNGKGQPAQVSGVADKYTLDQGTVPKVPETQTGGGYTFDLNANSQIAGQPVVDGYSNGGDGCLDMASLNPPVSGFGKCTPTCDKNPYLVQNQKAGQRKGNMEKAYRSIINPKTGRKVKLTSRTGQKILRRYVKHFAKTGGTAPVPQNDNLDVALQSDFSPDMSTRQFGCKQPNWEPKCI